MPPAFADDVNWMWSSGKAYDPAAAFWLPELFTDPSVAQTPLPYTCVALLYYEDPSGAVPSGYRWNLYGCEEEHRCVHGSLVGGSLLGGLRGWGGSMLGGVWAL